MIRQNESINAIYTSLKLYREMGSLGRRLRHCTDLSMARDYIREYVFHQCNRAFDKKHSLASHRLIRIRDCSRMFLGMLNKRSEIKSGFSLVQALWDIARQQKRDDLSEAFYADIVQLLRGLRGGGYFEMLHDYKGSIQLAGRDAAIARSNQLDEIWTHVSDNIDRFETGLGRNSRSRRRRRRDEILAELNGKKSDWNDWKWHINNIASDAKALSCIVNISPSQYETIEKAKAAALPFGVTPYYVSLIDNEDSSRDMAIRAQVLPNEQYVEKLASGSRENCDFMLETDTSPIDLITRRYPSIAILKPFNTCPQICVYCQRNWEIEQAMAHNALADWKTIEAAIGWISDHPAIREVLVTGGDPFAMDDEVLAKVLRAVAAIPHVDIIRIGTRTLVTLPMRITKELAGILSGLRRKGRREIAIITHVEHVYEITPAMVLAVQRLRSCGISVYNQHVYTFFVSRKFENAALRMLLRRIGIEPYYTFAPKGKEEMAAYRVPLSRILQERKEEARLVPGIRRSDEPVFNVPGLGKNHLRAAQHHDLLSVLPDGARLYEFHPWEKNIVPCEPYVCRDVPILNYLRRLEEIGENTTKYGSIWYY